MLILLLQLLILSKPGLHKTGIRGIQDTRQIVDGKTKTIMVKKVGPDLRVGWPITGDSLPVSWIRYRRLIA